MASMVLLAITSVLARPSLDDSVASELGMELARGKTCTNCEDAFNEEAKRTSAANGAKTIEDTVGDVCPICSGKFLENQGRRFNCNHKFHKKCIQEYSQSEGTFCPICGSDLHLPDGKSYTKLVAQQIDGYYQPALKHWGLQMPHKD